MLKITINKQASAKLLRVMSEAPEKIEKAMNVSLFRCGNTMRNEATDLVRYKTGHLRGSIDAKVQGSKKVTVGTDLIYAPIHEFGGTIKPKNKEYLTFKVNGRWVRAKKVTIKPKPYLRPAFQKMVNGEAVEIFTEELNRAIN